MDQQPGNINTTSLEAAIMAVANSIQSNGGTLNSNPHKFSAYRNAAFSSVNGAYTKVPFDVEDFDTNNNFDTATNVGRYTAPVDGYYQFQWTVALIISSPATDIVAALYKNGVAYKWGIESTGVGGGVNGSALVQAAANDYFEIYLYANASSTVNVGNTKYTHFSGFLVTRT